MKMGEEKSSLLSPGCTLALETSQNYTSRELSEALPRHRPSREIMVKMKIISLLIGVAVAHIHVCTVTQTQTHRLGIAVPL